LRISAEVSRRRSSVPKGGLSFPLTRTRSRAVAKIPGLDPNRKPSGDGPNQPGGPAAHQPPPFLQKRRNQVIAAVLMLAVLLILPLSGMGTSPPDGKELSEILTALPTGQLDGHKITKAGLDDDNRVLLLTLDNGDEYEASYPNQ